MSSKVSVLDGLSEDIVLYVASRLTDSVSQFSGGRYRSGLTKEQEEAILADSDRLLSIIHQRSANLNRASGSIS